jgi:hypothetical protein
MLLQKEDKMKKMITSFAATTLLVSSFALAGSIGNSIDASRQFSKALSNGAVVSIDLSVNGARLLSRAAQFTENSVASSIQTSTEATRAFTVKVISDLGNSTDIKLVKFASNGLEFSVNASASVVKNLTEGARLILTRTEQGAYVLVREVGGVTQEVLQLDIDDATGQSLMLIGTVADAVSTDRDETLRSYTHTRDK